jgi:hypothetical protein
MLATLFKAGQWGNLAILLAQILNSVTQVFPNLTSNPKLLAVQAFIGIFLPSVGGIAHKMAFGEEQTPAARS